MTTLGIRQRLSELKEGIAAIGAKLRSPGNDEPAPAQSDEPTTVKRAGVANVAAFGDAYSYAVRRPRPSRYY